MTIVIFIQPATYLALLFPDLVRDAREAMEDVVENGVPERSSSDVALGDVASVRTLWDRRFLPAFFLGASTISSTSSISGMMSSKNPFVARGYLARCAMCVPVSFSMHHHRIDTHSCQSQIFSEYAYARAYAETIARNELTGQWARLDSAESDHALLMHGRLDFARAQR